MSPLIGCIATADSQHGADIEYIFGLPGFLHQRIALAAKRQPARGGACLAGEFPQTDLEWLGRARSVSLLLHAASDLEAKLICRLDSVLNL
jgi:hypothetical protein